MIFAALDEAASRGELILVYDGMIRFHLRKDGVLVVREVIVMPCRRRTGLGRLLVNMASGRYPGHPVLARCPASSEANAFWAALGYSLTPGGKVNEWRSP